MKDRRLPVAAAGVGVAAATTVVTYALYAVFPHEHIPLDEFLSEYGRANAAVWPMQIVSYVAVLAIVAVALRPFRGSRQLAGALTAAYLAWVGVGYFLVASPGMSLAAGWAAVFVLQAVLVLFAGAIRGDLIIRPRRDVTSVLGAVVIAYALLAYPVVGLFTTGHPLSALPVIGLSPCATAIMFFGLLLWAEPPAPLYLLPLPLAWALNAAPANQAAGFVPDVGLIVAGVGTAMLLIWRDLREAWQKLAAGLLLALMIAWSGHDDVLIGTAAVLSTVILWRAAQPLSGGIGRAPDQPAAGG